MRLHDSGVTFTFGVNPTGAESVTESGIHLPTLTAATAPGEADSPQLLAAEQVGLFPYSYAAHRDSVKGHSS